MNCIKWCGFMRWQILNSVLSAREMFVFNEKCFTLNILYELFKYVNLLAPASFLPVLQLDGQTPKCETSFSHWLTSAHGAIVN